MKTRLWPVAVLVCGLPVMSSASDGVLTYHNSNLRHGAYQVHALTTAAAATMRPDPRFQRGAERTYLRAAPVLAAAGRESSGW